MASRNGLFSGQIPSPKMWKSPGSQLIPISMPAIKWILCFLADSSADFNPAIVSWSVRAMAESPSSFAFSMSSAGLKLPSEAFECVCKSIVGDFSSFLIFELLIVFSFNG